LRYRIYADPPLIASIVYRILPPPAPLRQYRSGQTVSGQKSKPQAKIKPKSNRIKPKNDLNSPRPTPRAFCLLLPAIASLPAKTFQAFFPAKNPKIIGKSCKNVSKNLANLLTKSANL